MERDQKKILIVDDEKNFLTIIKINLELSNKYKVLTLSSAKNIISEVRRFKPDLILLDMIMPEIGGLDVCEILHDDPIGKNIPIVILSSLDNEKDKARAHMLGVVFYLEKSISKDELIASIEKALCYYRN